MRQMAQQAENGGKLKCGQVVDRRFAGASAHDDQNTVAVQYILNRFRLTGTKRGEVEVCGVKINFGHAAIIH